MYDCMLATVSVVRIGLTALWCEGAGTVKWGSISFELEIRTNDVAYM